MQGQGYLGVLGLGRVMRVLHRESLGEVLLGIRVPSLQGLLLRNLLELRGSGSAPRLFPAQKLTDLEQKKTSLIESARCLRPSSESR